MPKTMPGSPTTVDILTQRRRSWRTKPVLRRLYRTWYETIRSALTSGRILEIGGGSGNLKEFIDHAWVSDIVPVPWIDVAVDAHHIPAKDGCLGNLVLFDVLHHLSSPAVFFREADRVLRPGGRLLMMEPNVSLASFPIYRFFHHEGLQWTDDPFNLPKSGGKRPMDGNQAIPTLIFDKHRSKFFYQFPMFRSVMDKKMDFVIYPLSGGFHHPSL